MANYRATITRDGTGFQVVVHWDDNDPRRFITMPRSMPGDAGEDDLATLLALDGYRLDSVDVENIERGWAVVSHSQPHCQFWDPFLREWFSSLCGAQKETIRQCYPEASVPGVNCSLA